ncbi:MAG: TolC family protein, partial [Armatimonadetes bacterium]|nr:TolC family protein [Armatimonadota bacterium]
AAAERKPSLSAVASYNSEGSDVPNLENWNVGFAVSLPVFDGGRIRAATREAEAELGARQAERELLRQQLELEVTGAVLRIQDALERVAATTKAVAEARETLNIQRRAYELGVGTALDVFDAQTALTQADVNHTQALTDAQTATAELTYAVGRDPQPQPEEQ